MRHKNSPHTYNLPADPSQDQRDAAKKELTKKLERAFKEIIEAGLLDREPNKTPASTFGTLFGRQDENAFPVSLLGRIDPEQPLQEGDTSVWLKTGPQVFLRLIPIEPTANFDPLDLRQWLPAADIQDLMGYRTKGAFYYTRNQSGAAAFTIDLSKTAESRKDAYAFGVTQGLREWRALGCRHMAS
jgi:hypothetical protein